MDRDVLLLLLVGGVLLNTGLLVLAAVLRVRQSGSRRGSRASDVELWRAAVIPRQTLGTGATIVRAAHRAGSSAALAHRAPGMAATPTGSAAPAGSAAPVVSAAPVAPPAAPGESAAPVPPVMAAVAVAAAQPPPAPWPAREPSPTAVLPESSEPASSAPGPAAAAPAGRPAPVRRSARPRRFTMPDLEEDHDRAARSIAAFLGEPVARTPGAHPHRRRHRARRPAGATVRSDIVLVVGGDPGGSRVAHAVAAALRDTVRASDEVVEIPGGRVRVTLEADSAGAEAFVTRARSVVRPWLDLLGPGLDLRVESGLEPERVAPAAS